jgi:hypothetical protein
MSALRTPATVIAAALPVKPGWVAAIAAAHAEIDRIFDRCTAGERYFGEAGVKLCLHRKGTSDDPFTFRTPPDGIRRAAQPCRRQSPANQAARRRLHAEFDRQAARAAGFPSLHTLVRCGFKVQDDTVQAVTVVLIPSED